MTLARTRSAEQLAASHPEASVWVGASAGSGKTSVLSDRVLRLLLVDGTRPERLLCLTFTKAAAAEMKTRVMAELASWAAADATSLADHLFKLLGKPASEDETVRARRLFARAIDAPGGLKIQTLHGFCQSLLGRFPLEAGVVPYFEAADERTAEELMVEARNRVLAEAQSGGALAQALRTVTERAGEERFDELLRALAAERGRLRRVIDDHGTVDAAAAAIFDHHGADPGTTPEQMIAEHCEEAPLDLAALRRAASAMALSGVDDQKRAPALARFLAEGDRRIEFFDDYRLVFLTKEGTVRGRLCAKAIATRDPAIQAAMVAEADRLLALDRRLKAHRLARATAALVRLAVAVGETYESLKHSRALLDYDDLILKTRDLLKAEGVAPWVLFKLDGGLDHILIDEAQDTNPDQWQVIESLAEEFFSGEGARDAKRTIFAVGDHKQSIFSFQRADPREFERMKLHFALRVEAAAKDWVQVDLETSFRSTQAVLSVVDAVFARPEALAGVAPENTRIQHKAHRAGAAGVVELWPLIEPAERDPFEAWTPPVTQRATEDPETQLAALLARRIRGWVGKEKLPSKDRMIRPGDIMVLVRRRGAFLDALVRSLKQQDVPVAGADRILLTDQLAVMDLVALGHALLLPSDDLTLATVLKGPLVGFDEEQLFKLAHGREGVSLWRRLAQIKDQDPAYGRAHDFISDLLARVDLMPPFALFAHVLGPMRGRRKIRARLGPESLDALEEFLNAAIAYERGHPPSLEGFLRWLEASEEDIRRDLEHGVRDEVRVMTVHGAKGLQAPIVILPDTVSQLRDDTQLFWAEQGLPVWCARSEDADAVAARLRTAARQRRDEEQRRLLYVAMTRAEDRLYVCGWQTQKAPSDGCWYQLIEAGLKDLDGTLTAVVPSFEKPGLRFENAQSAPIEATRAATVGTTSLLPEWATRPPPPEPTPPKPLAPSRPEDPEPPARSPMLAEDTLRFRRGRLVHRLLQSLPELPPASRAAAGRRWLGRKGQGLTADEADELLKETLAILDDPALAPLFGPESRPEVPVSGVIGRHVVAGQVDRLVALPGKVMVIDYKTNRPAPADPAKVAALYLRQMAAYRAVLRLVYPGRPVECHLLWTETPRLMALPDALLNRYTPA
ncbi:MAG: double-strand break repair helicase AddA [Alphaproteobacteria bacterium]|nr:double-strand break repair helicase AddA [Alphaproteobacteria bacterium]